MLQSMTGYGRGEAEGFGRRFLVEMRSVNHRYSEIAIRLPRQFNMFEDQIRQRIQASISRGRVDVYITVEDNGTSRRKVIVDKELALTYYNSLRELVAEFGFHDDLGVSILTRVPDIFSIEEEETPAEDLWNACEEAVVGSLNGLVAMRQVEGEKLKTDVLNRLASIEQMVKEIEVRAPQVVEEYRDKLNRRLTELMSGHEVEEVRLIQEVAIFADRGSIAEEITRLYSHLTQFAGNLQQSGPIGRKLDFLVQEMNREINTIGSKTGDLFITNCVVDVKSEIEKIREQIQNIE